MDSDKDIDAVAADVDVDESEIISPHWNEFYVDGASLTIDEYAIRIAFVNHFPQNNPERRVNVSRKVDVVMSEKAFDSLYKAMGKLIEIRNKRDQITQSKDEE